MATPGWSRRSGACGRAVGAVLVLLLAWAAMPAVARARAHASLPRLHAVRGGHPRIATGDGRQVLLRGVNVNELGDYHQQDPAVPPTFPLRPADFAGIRRLGMDVVRLIVSWSALEPTRGAFDAAYVARIRQAVRWAAARHLYVVLDLHQDAWGTFIATPASATCAPPTQPQHGWDGAPAWATLTGGASTCFTGEREVAPAVAAAFQSFYDDDQGIQDELVATWARLAKAFAADPAVAGYDLLNEPNPGLRYPSSMTQALARYYAHAIRAIRGAERSVAGGFAHIAFFEPGVIWSAAGTDVLPDPALIADRDVVFSPHLYAGSIAPIPVPQGFRDAQVAARRYGTAVWSGEWGFFSADPADDQRALHAYAAEEDRHRWGGAWWDWKQSCGDVHQYADRDDATPSPISPSLNRFACPGNRPLGIPATTRRVLARPYARFAPGRLTRLRSDPASGRARLAGTDARRRGSCRVEVWVPGRAHPHVRGRRVTRLHAARVAGGWTVGGCARGRYALSLR